MKRKHAISAGIMLFNLSFESDNLLKDHSFVTAPVSSLYKRKSGHLLQTEPWKYSMFI